MHRKSPFVKTAKTLLVLATLSLSTLSLGMVPANAHDIRYFGQSDTAYQSSQAYGFNRSVGILPLWATRRFIMKCMVQARLWLCFMAVWLAHRLRWAS